MKQAFPVLCMITTAVAGRKRGAKQFLQFFKSAMERRVNRMCAHHAAHPERKKRLAKGTRSSPSFLMRCEHCKVIRHALFKQPIILHALTILIAAIHQHTREVKVFMHEKIPYLSFLLHYLKYISMPILVLKKFTYSECDRSMRIELNP